MLVCKLVFNAVSQSEVRVEAQNTSICLFIVEDMFSHMCKFGYSMTTDTIVGEIKHTNAIAKCDHS